MPVDQVEQWEQVNPDDVDEVPVEAADFDRGVLFWGEASLPGHGQQPGKNPEADDHVQRVQAGHDEIEREENLRVARVGVLPGMAGDRHMIETERRAGDVMLFEFVFVFDALDAEKDQPSSMVMMSLPIRSVRRAVCAAQTARTTVKLLQMSTAVLVAPRAS